MDYLDVPVIDFSNAYSEKINERFKLAEEIGAYSDVLDR